MTWQRTLFNATYSALSGIGLLAAIVLLYLLLVTPTPNMGVYRIFILNVILGDVLIAVSEALSLVSIVPTGAGFTLSFDGVCQQLSPSFCFLLYDVTFVTYFDVSILCLIGFIYRYQILQGHPITKRAIVSGCAMLYASIAIPGSAILASLTIPKNETDSALHAMYPGREFTATQGIGHLESDIRIVLLESGALAFCFVLNGSIFAIRRKIVRTLAIRVKFMSSGSSRMHREFLKVLTIQSVVPVLLFVVVLVSMLHQFVFTRSLVLDYLMFQILGLIPIINSSVNIVFIHPYRKQFLRIFCGHQDNNEDNNENINTNTTSFAMSRNVPV